MALEKFITRLVTAGTVTQFSTQVATFIMTALPFALLDARFAWLPAFCWALAVDAVIGTRLGARRTLLCAADFAAVPTEESSLTFGLAMDVEAALSAITACTCVSLKFKTCIISVMLFFLCICIYGCE